MKPQEYGPFPYSPIHQRPRIAWPDGARVALWVIPNIEFFALDQPISGQASRTPNVPDWSARDYGNRVGVFRLMEVMERFGIRGTVALNSDLCARHPEIISRAAELGWENMGHCESNTRPLSQVPAEKELETIQNTLDTIGQATRKRPRGWLGAGLQETWTTLDNLIEAGVDYVADWVNDDQPYVMSIDGKEIVSIPYTRELNDRSVIGRFNRSAGEFEQQIRDQFDVLYREGADSGRVMAIALHPYIIGVPHRIVALERALEYVCSHEAIWRATGSEIVDAFRSQVGS
jgi:peptidoglycan/xylan/chitin deacetylase (PgdA/CDA1 family)